tara:strand:+ start:1278 stop:1766 length:489 start_codon:yes stop_codon:yes gene_type:complete
MEDQTVKETTKINVQQKTLSLVEKSISIQKDRKEQKVRKNEIFKTAIENAEKIALNSVCFPEDEISRLLENAEESSGIKQIQWFWLLRNEEDFIILEDGIETPTRWNRNARKEEDIKFRFSRFFKKEDFINKCKEYYGKYNCNIDITRTKGPRWEISIKQEN